MAAIPYCMMIFGLTLTIIYLVEKGDYNA